jgi:dihydroorotase
MKQAWRIRNGRLVDPVTGRDEVADLYIEDGCIRSAPPGSGGGFVDIDAKGLVVVPGLIDLHTHFREPGNEEAEDIRSGSRAAARGGFTTVVTMPNTTPATDSAAMVRRTLARARECGSVRVLPSGCITKGRLGQELADLKDMRAAGAVTFTDDGSTVADGELLLRAMAAARDLGVPLMEHALDPALAGAGVMHEGACSARLGLPGIPSAAEESIVARDVLATERTGGRMHIQHVSCRASVDLIRAARATGLPVSGEATPHHLGLTDAAIDGADSNFKMNPPLRDAADREALRHAVADGTITAFATDHAPHRAADKARGFLRAPFGVVGLETAVGVTYSLLVQSGRMPLIEWLRRWTTGPAAVLGMPCAGLADGAPADLAILDLASTWVVRARDFASRSRNTPFEGQTLTGRAVYTFLGGAVTWRTRMAS